MLHQVGVSFDLYCDALKHKINKTYYPLLWAEGAHLASTGQLARRYAYATLSSLRICQPILRTCAATYFEESTYLLTNLLTYYLLTYFEESTYLLTYFLTTYLLT